MKDLPFMLLFGIKNKIIYHSDRFKKKILFDGWSISSRLHPDEYMRVLFLGKDDHKDKNYFRSLIFNEDYIETYLGKVWIWKVFFFLWGLAKNHDLTIVKTRMKICDLFKSKKSFVIPDWISCEIDLCCDIASQSKSRRTYKSNIKKIKKSNFEYTITKDPVFFQFFYDNMHRPYISKRHGDLAVKISFEKMKRSFENGELLLVKDAQEIVAGVIIDYKVMNGIPRITQLGVLRGEFDYVKKGALIALYYYTIEYLRKRNHKKFSLGSVRPFLCDGVLNHKLNWGAKIVCETSNAFLLSVSSHKACLKTFLFNNPFICKDKNRLTLATFTDNEHKNCQYLPNAENKFKLCGIDRQTLFSL